MQVLGYTNGQKKLCMKGEGRSYILLLKGGMYNKELKAIELGLELCTFDLFPRFDMKFRKRLDSTSSKTLMNPKFFSN